MDNKPQVRSDGNGQKRTLKNVVENIQQRRLVRVAIAYAVGAWVVVQVVATVGPAFDLPAWTLRAVILLALAGFFITAAYVAFAGPADAVATTPVARRRRLTLAATAVLVLLAGAGTLVYSQGAALLGGDRFSVAVLPFADMSPTRDKAYFAEGVAEEILSTLAAEKDIKVLGRTSARQIERDPDPQAIRASLGVTHFLEGSTRTAGDQLRVNVRLIDTSDGSQLWEEEYQGKLADVFDVQDRIATTVVRRLRGTFFGGTVRQARATAIDAYQSYLAARSLIRENKKEPMIRAWKMARQIVELHPDYAQGHAIYAELTHLLTEGQFSYGNIRPEISRPIILAHARRAIRLSPDRAEGYAAIGLALPWQDSIAPYLRALELDPSRGDVRVRLGIALNQLRRNDEAARQYRLAVETDPLSAALVNRHTQVLAASGRADEALQAVDQFLQRGGSVAQGWRFRGNVYRYLGDEARQIAARRRALQLDPGLPYQHEWLVLALSLLGLPDQAGEYQQHVSPYFQMFTSENRGALKARVETDGAFAWDANGIQVAIFALARARDWPAILQFYDVRPATYRDVCVTAPPFTTFLILALRQHDRAGEAQHLLDCTQRHVSRQLAMHHRAPDDVPGELEMTQASLLALRNDVRALDWLDKAVRRNWLGQYYSSRLSDWPQFDRFGDDPRYAALQRTIDAKIATERAATLTRR